MWELMGCNTCIMHKSETDWMHARGQPANPVAIWLPTPTPILTPKAFCTLRRHAGNSVALVLSTQQCNKAIHDDRSRSFLWSLLLARSSC